MLVLSLDPLADILSELATAGGLLVSLVVGRSSDSKNLAGLFRFLGGIFT
jgi:hypothetical protein